MTLKKLALLGGALAGAAYLRDKTRRDSFMQKARGLVDQARDRIGSISGQQQGQNDEMASSSGESGFRDYGAPYTPSSTSSPRGNGIY